MQDIFISVLFYFLSSQIALEALPNEATWSSEISGSKGFRDFENGMQRSNVVSDIISSTTESENKTNIVDSVWRKISSIFGTETEPEPRKEALLPEDKLPPNGRESSERDLRMAPVDFSKQNEANFYPVPRRLRKRLHRSFDANVKEAAEVRKKESFLKDKQTIKRYWERPTDRAIKKVSVINEEFDQGETAKGRMKRFKDDWKSTDWKTEKIIVGSDQVENIDNTNYIEEAKDIDFPFHVHSIEPIIIEDGLADEVTTLSEKELPPLKIIKY